MIPLLVIAVVVGGSFLLASQRAPRAQLPPGAPPLPQPPAPRAPAPELPTSPEEEALLAAAGVRDFASPTSLAIEELPRGLGDQVAALLAGTTGTPDAADQLSAGLRAAGFAAAADLVAQKAEQLRQAQAMGVPAPASRDMWVRAQRGLNIREFPSRGAKRLGVVPFGRTVRVLDQSGGWARIQSLSNVDHFAFVCNECPEEPGGPWLVAFPPDAVA